MNLLEALQRIRALGVPSFETRDVSALLQVSPANASMLLGRLARHGQVSRLARGKWMLGTGSRAVMAEQLAAPYPAYVSLQSALFRHGVIEQVPAITFAVTLGRARRIPTPHGMISLHRIPPALFGGFAVEEDGGKLATVEKALFDLLYLAPGRSRIFSTLPELAVPRRFQWQQLKAYTELVKAPGRRAYISQRIAAIRARSMKAKA